MKISNLSTLATILSIFLVIFLTTPYKSYAACVVTYDSGGQTCATEAGGLSPGNYCFKETFGGDLEGYPYAEYSQYEVQSNPSCSAGVSSKDKWYKCDFNDPSPCGGGGGSVGPPDDDIAWVRIFSRSFNSTEVYYGPADASGLSVNSTNRKDWNVRASTNTDFPAGEMWSGHMCGRGKAASVATDGKLKVVDNSACVRSGETCAYDDGDGCTQVEWFSGGPGLADLDADRDKISPVNRLYHILKDGFNKELDKDGDWVSVTIPNGMPMQRYDKIYTFNFKEKENDDWRVRISTPMSYFCYNAYGLARNDEGEVSLGDKDSGGGLVREDSTGERLHIRPEQEDSTLGVLDDGTRCDVELAFNGGGNYVLFEVRKSVIGKVVSIDGTTNSATGLPNVQVRLRYNRDNATPVTVTTTTDANGYYRFNDPNLYSSEHYTVDVTSSAPTGHTGSAKAVNPKNYLAATGSAISYTWRSNGRDTVVGDTQYFGQSTITNNDCSSSNVEANLNSGRCVFAFTKTALQFPNGTLNVVNNSNKVPSGLSYDHAVCLNGSVSYATTIRAYPLLRPNYPYSLSTSVTGATSGYGTWVNQFQTFTGTPGSTMSSTDSNAYTTARGYKAGSNYYVALTVNDSVAKMCSGNPYVNYSTYSPSTTKYCGVYNPNMVNPMTDTNANKPYKTIHIPYTPVAPTVVASTGLTNQVTITWSYPVSIGVPYFKDVKSYKVYRNGTLIGEVPTSTSPANFRFVDTGANCNGGNIQYSVRAETGYTDINSTFRSCGISTAGVAIGTCAENVPPICDSITFDPITHQGASSVTVTSKATDLLSKITTYKMYIKNSAGKQVFTTLPESVSGNVAGTSVTKSTVWPTKVGNLPGEVPVGKYTVYVDWTDALGNVTNKPSGVPCFKTYDIQPSVQIKASKITVVTDADQCLSTPGVPFANVGVRLDRGSEGSSMNATTLASPLALSGTYSFPQANLKYDKQYSVSIMTINGAPFSGYAACPDYNITTFFNTPKTYTGPGSNEYEISPIKLYKQDSTKWWQAYNGGVHSNIQRIFPLNGAGGDEGMPSNSVIIGDPTGINIFPKGLDMYTLLGIDTNVIPRFDGGGLYSSFGTVPPNGVFYGNDPKNWGVPNLTEGINSKMRFATSIDTMFEEVKSLIASGTSNWRAWNTFPAAVNYGRSYLSIGGGNPPKIGGPVSSDSVSVSVVFIEVNKDGTLVIEKNITSNNTKPLILYIKGNVLIKPDVTELDSVFIIATGQITFESEAEDSDQAININGGIYGRDIFFNRDLPDSLVEGNYPAERIFYNSSLILNSNDLPAEVTESKVYYILTE